MSRLKELRTYVNGELEKMEKPDKRIGAINHLYGVSLAATMIAKKRGMDPELAAMAAMMHDLAAYKSGSYDDHAHKGAVLVKGDSGHARADECGGDGSDLLGDLSSRR